MPLPAIAQDDLIAAIYDAALDPTQWQECYDQLRSVVAAESTLATLQDPAIGQAALLACNMDAAFVQEYANGWWQKDTWAQGGFRHPRGRAFITSDIVPDAEWMRSEIYNELVRPLADCRHCLGVIVDVGGSLGVMGFHRPTMASNFSRADRQRFQRLVPHIQRALQIGQKLEQQDVMRRAALAAIDGLSFGLIVVDAAARPLLMNRVAETFLGRGRGMLGGNGASPLRAESIAETAAFHRLVHEVTASRSSGAGAVQVSRAPPHVPLMLLVSPLVGRQAAVLNVGKAAALVLVQDPDQKAAPAHRVMRDLFGLTTAEIELADGLALGARLEEIAEQQGVKLSTIRTQLKSVLSKTDTDRQASLVRLLTRLSMNGGQTAPR